MGPDLNITWEARFAQMVLTMDRGRVWGFGPQIIICIRARFVGGVCRQGESVWPTAGQTRSCDLLARSTDMTLSCVKRALGPRTMGLIGPRSVMGRPCWEGKVYFKRIGTNFRVQREKSGWWGEPMPRRRTWRYWTGGQDSRGRWEWSSHSWRTTSWNRNYTDSVYLRASNKDQWVNIDSWGKTF